MCEHQQEIMEELQQILLELSGDVIALETFCRSGHYCMEDFGPHICGAYVQRIGDYTAQHIQDIRQLTSHLLDDSGKL